MNSRKHRSLGKAIAGVALAVSMLLPANVPGHAQSPAPAGRWNIQFLGPDTIADIAASVAPSVVNINATTNVSREQIARYRADARGRDDGQKRLKKYFGMDSPPDSGEYMKVTGSGVVVKADGHILTSLHVVENASKISVTLQDGRTFDGVVVARDRFSDLALIKIPATNLQVATFGNADLLRPGDWVVAIGNQFGLGHSVTHGLVSGLAREAKGFDKSFGARTGAVRFIQTDAPINPGSSGGPLVNLKGEIVGINTFIRDDAQNIGFAIPANLAREVADKLVSGGSLAHPYIGIIMKDPATEPAMPDAVIANGVEVVEVKFRSPASTAGIVPGDVILEIDQSPVKKSDDVSSAVRKRNVGESMRLKIKRSGAEKIVELKVEQLPEEGD